MVAPTPSSFVGLSSPSALWAKAIAASAARSVAGLQPSSALSVRKAATWTGAAGRVRTPRPPAHFVHLAQWDLYTSRVPGLYASPRASETRRRRSAPRTATSPPGSEPGSLSIAVITLLSVSPPVAGSTGFPIRTLEQLKAQFKLGCLFGPFCSSGDPAAPISAPRRSQRQDRTPQPPLTPISRIPRIPACDGRWPVSTGCSADRPSRLRL